MTPRQHPDDASLIEFLVVTMILLLAFAAIFIGGPVIAEYIEQVPGV